MRNDYDNYDYDYYYSIYLKRHMSAKSCRFCHNYSWSLYSTL